VDYYGRLGSRAAPAAPDVTRPEKPPGRTCQKFSGLAENGICIGDDFVSSFSLLEFATVTVARSRHASSRRDGAAALRVGPP
jgi:hypothetical protein